MNYNTYLDYIRYNSDVLQTNFINKHSCCLKEADLETAWWAHFFRELSEETEQMPFSPIEKFPRIH